ncbi:MAG: glutaredoxin 3 [Rhodospirillales bacterium]|nr:glutaredoxin 3 [Rhodospirillales bacterium]
MAKIEIYHKTWCGFSRAALKLLREKGVAFIDIDVTDDAIREEEMVMRSGRITVPEIFIDGELIGGYDDLAGLDAAGELAAKLGPEDDPWRKAA